MVTIMVLIMDMVEDLVHIILNLIISTAVAIIDLLIKHNLAIHVHQLMEVINNVKIWMMITLGMNLIGKSGLILSD